MDAPFLLKTGRLGLRRWTAADLEPFARMNGDAQVMRYFPSILTRRQSDEFVGRISAHFDRYGYGLYAVEELATGRFMGFIYSLKRSECERREER